MSSINTELQDVQRIMVANIEEVLQRGEALSSKHMKVDANKRHRPKALLTNMKLIFLIVNIIPFSLC